MAPPYQPTWDDPLGPNAWTNLSWAGMEELHSGLVMLVGADEAMDVKCVGTAFIISARARYAVCATAAHNFYLGLNRAQTPHARHHPSALPEFIASFETVDLTRVHAVYRHADRVTACNVTGVVWDKKSDLCFFEMEMPSPTENDFVQGEWPVAVEEPTVGQLVGVLGYAKMGVTPLDPVDDALKAGRIGSQLLLRVGRVTGINDGGLLTRGRCVETTIPVFGGMSGGPAFIWNAPPQVPRVFGLVSSDPEDPDNDATAKHDFAVPGRCTAVALCAQDGGITGTERHLLMRVGPMDAVLGQLRIPFYPDGDSG